MVRYYCVRFAANPFTNRTIAVTTDYENARPKMCKAGEFLSIPLSLFQFSGVKTVVTVEKRMGAGACAAVVIYAVRACVQAVRSCALSRALRCVA